MREPRQRSKAVTDNLPAPLIADINHAGYYPAVVTDVVALAVAGEEVTAHFVYPETTFDAEDEVRRHVTVLVLSPTRLVIVHADDHTEGQPSDRPGLAAAIGDAAGAATRLTQAGRTYAAASSETIPLSRINAVVSTHVFDRPERYRPGGTPREVTLGIAWGVASRIDLEPASCEDPDCDADHGYTGSLTGDDLSIRVSSDAEGDAAVTAALEFAGALSAATARLP